MVLAASLIFPAKAEQAPPVDACAMLTAEDIAAVTGRKVGSPMRNGGGSTTADSYSSTCVWRLPADADDAATDAPLHGSNYAMLNAWSWVPGSDGPKRFLQEFRDAAANNLIDMKPVPLEIGDEALYWGDGVAMRKGRMSFGISVHLVGGKPTEQTMESALARKILSRL